MTKKMAKIKIKQVKSGIDRPERQKRTLRALGFTKLNQVIEKESTPQIIGSKSGVEFGERHTSLTCDSESSVIDIHWD